jgi:putative thioredoxin
VKSPHVLDVTTATFQQDVIEASMTMPVIVDFWAPWCAPCRSLGPILEKLADEYGGRFRLAKVNSDENGEVSQAFGVRSIPDVRVVVNGKIVDQFTGALPEGQIRAFIQRAIPAPEEAERRKAAELRAAGDTPGAAAALARSLELNAEHHPARIDLAALMIDLGQLADATALLDAVPNDIDWDTRVATLRQAIAFAKDGGNEVEFAAKVAASPDDLDARLTLAGAYASRKAWKDAMEQLLEVIRRNKGHKDGQARKDLIAIFNLAEGEPDLVSAYRRKLAGLLN